MATPLLERGATQTPTVQRNARYSLWARAKRPIPATRREADELFAPHARNAQARATRLHRANVLGLLHPEGRPYTAGELHEMILDALYPCDPGATPEGDTPSPTT